MLLFASNLVISMWDGMRHKKMVWNTTMLHSSNTRIHGFSLQSPGSPFLSMGTDISQDLQPVGHAYRKLSLPLANYASRPQASRLNCRSSRAMRRLGPHRDCTASKIRAWISLFSGLAWQTMAMKTGEHSNRLASLFRLQVMGSFNRRLRISSISEGVR